MEFNNIKLTLRQIAAGQVMPKELPTFSGDAKKWPMFISAYVNSSAQCEYSDYENLSRLQKCLKGKAVNSVIATLRMLYGQPAIILNAFIQLIRESPSVKADNLDALIFFSLLVQNLCTIMEASDMQQHLVNPSLLSKLDYKLPQHSYV